MAAARLNHSNAARSRPGPPGVNGRLERDLTEDLSIIGIGESSPIAS